MVKSKKNGGDREVWRRGRAGALIPGNTRNLPHFCTCIAMPARSCFGKYSEFSLGGGCSGAMEYTPSALWRDSAEFRWKFGPHHGRRLHATRTACNNTTSYTVHTISPKHIRRALSLIFAPSFAIQELQSTKKDETTDARHFCCNVLSLFSAATEEYSPISLRLIVYTTALEQLEGVAARFDQLHVGQYLFQYLTEFDSTSRRG